MTIASVRQPVHFNSRLLGATVRGGDGTGDTLPVHAGEPPPEWDERTQGRARLWQHPTPTQKSGKPAGVLNAFLRVRGMADAVPPAVIAASEAAAVPELCLLLEGVAPYVVRTEDLQREIVARGPVLTSFAACPGFLSFWEALLAGSASDEIFNSPASEDVVGVLAVLIIGWGRHPAPHWIVANSWGRTTSQLTQWGQNGCFRVFSGTNVGALEDNLTGVVRLTEFTRGGDGPPCISVVRLTRELLRSLPPPPKLQPLPACPDINTFTPTGKIDQIKTRGNKCKKKKNKKKKKHAVVDGKRVKVNLTLAHGKDAHAHPTNGSARKRLAHLRKWACSDDMANHPGMVLQCIVAAFIIILCILVLVALRKRPVVA
jgi:hypothetical protein